MARPIRDDQRQSAHANRTQSQSTQHEMHAHGLIKCYGLPFPQVGAVEYDVKIKVDLTDPEHLIGMWLAIIEVSAKSRRKHQRQQEFVPSPHHLQTPIAVRRDARDPSRPPPEQAQLAFSRAPQRYD